MNIGIIGSGAIGSSLATKLTKLGHHVSIANSRGPASLQQLAAETGAEAATIEEAVQNKQVIIVSIPSKNIPDLPKNLFHALPNDVVIIDTCNYYPLLRDGTISGLEESGIDSFWVQQQLGVPVVKVFNSVFATSLNDFSRPRGEKDRIALSVSGDDATAKDIASQLVDELGFDPFDMGTIAQSWRQQPGTSVFCRDINLAELKKRVDAMGTEWSEKRDEIIAQHHADESFIAVDHQGWLKSLQD